MVNDSSPKRRHATLQVQRCHLIREGGNAPQLDHQGHAALQVQRCHLIREGGNAPQMEQHTTRKNTREEHLSHCVRENLRTNILYLYGEEVYNRTKGYEKLRTKRGDLLCDLAFLTRCRDNNILPTFTRVTYHTESPKIKRILDRTSKALLREEIHRVRYNLDHTDKELLKLHLELSNLIHPTIWTQLETLSSWRTETNTTLRRERHIKKYTELERKQRPRPPPQLDTRKIVHNISSYRLTETDTKVLRRGLNFAVTPRSIPNEEIVSAVESAITHMDAEDADTVRQNVAHLLINGKPPTPNISKDEYRALKDLRNNEDIIILSADKGNATVIMNTAEYHEKMKIILDDPTYKEINTDPTTYLEKTTRKKILNSPMDPELAKQLAPRERSSRCPKIYGLPKIHKPSVPLRPIVSSIGSPLQKLARYLAQYIRDNTDRPASHVKNATEFVEWLQHVQLEPGDLLVSLDIVSLFTNIPIEETLDILSMNNDFPPHIIDLTAHCLHNTYFIYQGQRYRQMEGAPMGSPLSPIIADIFMEDFEKKALASAPLKPTKWLRYVDDTFVIWPHGFEQLTHFLGHLNSVHPKISFTMEMERNNKLPFLDVLVYKLPMGGLGHAVYRKPTHTDRYLEATSHHHPAQLHGVIKTLVHRSKRVADDNTRNVELSNLRHALCANGYPKGLINKVINNPAGPRREEKEQEQQHLAILPYIKGVTDKIGNLLRRHDIKPVFKPHRTISTMMNSPKDRIPLENQGVYSVPCGGCSKVYIGETSLKISARRDEHKRCIANKVATSSLYQHAQETGHQINWKDTRQLANIEHRTARKIREAIEIEVRENMNKRDDALNLPAAWKTCFRERKKNQNRPAREENNTTIVENVVENNSRYFLRPRTRGAIDPTTTCPASVTSPKAAPGRYNLRPRTSRARVEGGRAGIKDGAPPRSR